jgi:hypothetical protein
MVFDACLVKGVEVLILPPNSSAYRGFFGSIIVQRELEIKPPNEVHVGPHTLEKTS